MEDDLTMRILQTSYVDAIIAEQQAAQTLEEAEKSVVRAQENYNKVVFHRNNAQAALNEAIKARWRADAIPF